MADPSLTRSVATFIADVTAGSNLFTRVLGLLAIAALVGGLFGLSGAIGAVVGLILLYLAWLPVRRRRRDRLRHEAFVWFGSAADPGAEENFFIKPWYGRGSEGTLPTYVPRKAMGPLEEGLDDGDGRFVILTGNPTSGKSRLVYEVARRRPGHVTFVAGGIPGVGAADHLLELMEDPLGFSTWEEHQILVLRDLSQRLIARNISASFMADWLDRHPKVAVVATLDSEDLSRIEDDGEETVAELAALEERAKMVEVKDYLEGDELSNARRTFPDLTDEQLTWLPSYFVSANSLRNKLQGREAKQHPVGVAIVRASADWQRAGLSRPTPEHFLRQIVPQYVTGVLPEDADAIFDEELRWALEPVQGAAALLYRVDPEGANEGFRADGVIVERIEAAEPPEPIPRSTWDAIRDEVIDFSGQKPTADGPAADLIGMAEAAQRAGLSEMGRELLEIAGRLASGSQYRRIAEVFTASSVRGPALRSLLDGRYDDGFRYRIRASREQNRARRERVESEGKSIRGYIVSEIYSHRWWRAVIRVAVLATIDLVSSALGILLGLLLRSLVEIGEVHPDALLDDLSRSLIFLWIAITIALFALCKLYKEDAERARLGEILAAMGMLGLISFGAAVAADLNLEAMLTAFLVALICVVVAALVDFELRRLYDEVSTGWVERNELKARTLLIGGARHTAAVEELLEGGISRPIEVVGYMTTNPTEKPGSNFLGSLEDPDDLAAVALRHDIARVLIADPEMTVREREDLADLCHLRGLKVEAVPTIADVRAGSVRLAPGQPLLLMELNPLWLGNAAYATKRILDVTLTLLSAPVVIPLCIWSALRIAFLGGGRPIVADSWRPGVGMKIFGMRRFRTQSGFRSPIDETDRGDDREQHLTTVGAKLRRRGFDVLPQLLNVLTGKMSLVGPRPLHLSDHAKLADEHLLRYVIRPGVTGPWQVCDRETITCSELTKMDLAYLRNWTVLSDLEILIKTARMMIRGNKPLQLLVEDPQPASPTEKSDASNLGRN